MILMLAVILLCVGLGLWAPRLGTREHLMIASLATLMTALYLLFPYRFM